MRPRHSSTPIIVVLLTMASCGQEGSGTRQHPAEGEGKARLAQSPPRSPAKSERPVARVRLPGARQTFHEVVRLISEQYVDPDLSEDELWSGAIEGVMQRLIQVKDRKINTLLAPERVKEMQLGLKGSFSGVGMVIKIVEGMVMVRQLIPDGPADRAGIKPGDRLLAVDGKTVRDLDLGAIVGMIRGKTGSTVKLFLQREVREWEQPIVRGAVTLPAVNGQLLGSKVGYLQVVSFNKRTVAQLDAAMAELTKKGASGLLLDLRGSPGGLLDVAIEVADRFLPPGARVVSMKRREGVEEVRTATGDHPGDRLPVVVVVNRSTASGAEIVATALAENNRAMVVGEPTMGKGTVEKILQLKSGWALKLSIARFYSPKGNSLQGSGVPLDFVIPGGPGKLTSGIATRADESRLRTDPQVQAALRVLALRR